jgi:hypothetical protein
MPFGRLPLCFVQRFTRPSCEVFIGDLQVVPAANDVAVADPRRHDMTGELILKLRLPS